jgi:acyl carrier protein
MGLLLEEIKNMISSLLIDVKKDSSISYEEDLSGYYNSLMFVSFVVNLEDKYQIIIPDDDFKIENFTSIAKTASLIRKLLNH